MKLNNIKVLVGQNELIKHSYSSFLGRLGTRDVEVFKGSGKTIYLYVRYYDEYSFSTTGLDVKPFYGRPDYTKRKFRISISDSLRAESQEGRQLHEMGIIPDHIYKEMTKEDESRKLEYFRKAEKETLGNLRYIQSQIKKYESNT